MEALAAFAVVCLTLLTGGEDKLEDCRNVFGNVRTTFLVDSSPGKFDHIKLRVTIVIDGSPPNHTCFAETSGFVGAVFEQGTYDVVAHGETKLITLRENAELTISCEDRDVPVF